MPMIDITLERDSLQPPVCDSLVDDLLAAGPRSCSNRGRTTVRHVHDWLRRR